jgi:hypothetical protein
LPMQMHNRHTCLASSPSPPHLAQGAMLQRYCSHLCSLLFATTSNPYQPHRMQGRDVRAGEVVLCQEPMVSVLRSDEVRTRTHTHTHAHTHAHTRTHTHLRALIRGCTHATCTCARTCTRRRRRTRTRTRTCTHVYARTAAHRRMHVEVHTHACTYSCRCGAITAGSPLTTSREPYPIKPTKPTLSPSIPRSLTTSPFFAICTCTHINQLRAGRIINYHHHHSNLRHPQAAPLWSLSFSEVLQSLLSKSRVATTQVGVCVPASGKRSFATATHSSHPLVTDTHPFSHLLLLFIPLTHPLLLPTPSPTRYCYLPCYFSATVTRLATYPLLLSVFRTVNPSIAIATQTTILTIPTNPNNPTDPTNATGHNFAL